jgi:hypothetical protein
MLKNIYIITYKKIKNKNNIGNSKRECTSIDCLKKGGGGNDD